MDLSRIVFMNSLKSSLKWAFFFVLYPFMVLSITYNMGTGFTALLFSYIAIVPTLLLVKYAKIVRAKSVDLNEVVANFAEKRLAKSSYEKVIIALKVFRKVALVVLSLLAIKLLLAFFGLSTMVMPSLNAYLIVLLQAYYIAIVVSRVKYEI